VALQLALDPPPALRGVVLVAPGAYPDFPAGVLDQMITAPLVGRGLVHLLIPLMGEQLIRGELTRSVGPEGPVVPKQFFDQRVALWKRPAPLRAYAEHSLSFNRELEPMAHQYGKIARPVIILQGEADSAPEIRKRSAELANRIPGAQLRTFPATGHYLQYRHPQAVIEAVDMVYGVNARHLRNGRR